MSIPVKFISLKAALVFCLSLFVLFFLFACSSMPDTSPIKTPSTFRQADANANLTQYARQIIDADSSDSAVAVLNDGMDAFLARALLIEAAENSLDLQYYIWKNDITGKIMISLLLEAADRGVRIRLLLDDVNMSGKDAALITLDSHPNIELRLFNPFEYRSSRIWNFLTDFSRLNHRMHNKLFIADGRIAIIGGRNIGDEYFAASEHVEFADLDLLVVGRAVSQSGLSFDEYWNAKAAVPVASMIADSRRLSMESVRSDLEAFRKQVSLSNYAQNLSKSHLYKDVLNNELKWFSGPAQVMADRVDKITGSVNDNELLAAKIKSDINKITKSLLIISPYFVPNDTLMSQIEALAERGVKVKVLTNSLESTDVGIVHAGYQKYRRALLEMGVEIFELKSIRQKDKHKFHLKKPQIPGSSRSSLHAKVYIFDAQKLFTGSLNLDPRSVYINTEIGLLIENSQLAETFEAKLIDEIHEDAYQVILDEQGNLAWIDSSNNQHKVLNSEPGGGFFRSIGLWLLSLLPIEEQL